MIISIVSETVQFDGHSGKSIAFTNSLPSWYTNLIVWPWLMWFWGSESMQLVITYVGCSRVKSYKGLAFQNSFLMGEVRENQQLSRFTECARWNSRLDSHNSTVVYSLSLSSSVHRNSFGLNLPAANSCLYVSYDVWIPGLSKRDIPAWVVSW